MVRKMMTRRVASLFFATALLLFSVMPYARAADFTASVDRNQVAVGDSFTLSLDVSGTSPKTRPDLSVLDQDFTVYGTSQSSQMTFINGKQSSSIGWNVTLMPKKEGALKIPAFTINTDNGKLSSAPITINAVKPSNMVSQNGNTGTGTAQTAAVFVHAEINKTDVYQNEPVLLTARLIARKSVTNIDLPDFQVDSAIVEQQDKPEIYDGLINGERVKVVEVKYLLTPLASGTITLPGVTFQGQVESGRRQNRFANRFGGRIADPLGMFDNFGFNDYRPFAVSSDAITLNVKAPATQMDPWLPAQNLKISETWDGLDHAKTGEPITRHIRIAANGLAGAALPSLENMIDPQEQFKIYGDKPMSGETTDQDGESVNGWREESYTMIPRSTGDITLPAIKLAWWNTERDQIAYATLPAKTIHVQKGSAANLNIPPTAQQQQTAQMAAPPIAANQDMETANAKPQPAPPSHRHLYVIIAALGAAMLALLGTVAYLLRQLKAHKDGEVSQKQSRTVSRPANEDKVSLTAISRAGNARELQSVIQRYAHHHWNMPPQSSMQSISAHLKKHYAGLDTTALEKLDAILYAGKSEDLEAIKNDTVSIIKKSRTGSDKPAKKKMTKLNPS